MTRARAVFVALNVVGGAAVLGSYVHGLATHPDPGRLWGGIPEAWKPWYTRSMLLAAAGYFPFTYWFLARVEPSRVRIGPWGWGAVLACYAAILVGSALWLPLTFRMLERPSAALWALVRADLLLVGAGSLGLVACLFLLRPRGRSLSFWAAVVGLLAFCWQTVVLDALIWPSYFP